jgi:hypothetical protein
MSARASRSSQRAGAAGSCLAGLALLALQPPGLSSVAEAAVWRTCNGSPVIWRGGTTVHRNRCSIPESGDASTAYWNGIDAWNRMAGQITAFYANAATDCSVSHDDGENEIALVDRATIDGYNGLTVLQLGVCFLGANDLDEADVMVASDLPFLPVWGNFVGTTGRSTFVHEMGHFFGFHHEEAHSAMRASPPHLVTGGFEPATVWPSDTSGLAATYGFPGRANLLPAATGLVGGLVQTLDPSLPVSRCRGTSHSTRVTLANSGNVSTGSYGLRVRLSTVPPMAGYLGTTTVVASFGHALSAFSQGTYDLPFVIPANLPLGSYYIYVDLDPAGALAERSEGDNSTVSATLLLVDC